MAGDWIKMRVSLVRDPHTIAIADYLAVQRAFMDWLTNPVSQHCEETSYEHVTRNVTVSVTVSALLQIWGLANEIGTPDGDDLVLNYADLTTLSEVCCVPCMGEAMAEVGWAIETRLEDGRAQVRFPKFLLHNVPADDRYRRKAALRQRQYRQRQRKSVHALTSRGSNATNVMPCNVTVTDREEKRREEYKSITPCSPPSKKSVDSELLSWLKWWNELRRAGLVSAGVREQKPSQAVRKAWKRSQADAELRALLADQAEIRRQVAASTFCRGGWFRLEKLLGGKNRDGEFILRKLLDGAYRDDEPSKARKRSGAYDDRRPKDTRPATF